MCDNNSIYLFRYLSFLRKCYLVSYEDVVWVTNIRSQIEYPFMFPLPLFCLLGSSVPVL